MAIPGRAFSQINMYPSHLGQVSIAKGIYNPALQSTSGIVSLTSENQFYSNQLNQIRNFYLIGSVRIQKNDTASLHQRFGIKFVNGIEGDYISSPKIYGTYLWSQQLFRNLRLTAGINIGRANYTYHATLVTGTKTAGAWDGDLGIAITGDNYKVGLSVNQFFNSKFAPLNYSLRWKRFEVIYLERKLRLSTYADAVIFMQSTLLSSYPDRIDAGIQMILSKKFLIGVNYYLNNALIFTAGFNEIAWQNHQVTLLFTYSTPFNKLIQIYAETYELGIHYYLKKK